ncbi:redoxin domain-containing protein [Falsiroseomonas sp. HW251]|uniref:redoxin domain-containing protein n=1 Tax=Falsiroseomonas sp. HW251 TaxID=3390998 RepID=UPI003D322916
MATTVGALPQAAQAVGPAAPPFLVDQWLNAAAPLDAAVLRGRVGLVNFWTYSCIYALRSMSYIERWHEEYGPAGLQVVGIHTPEFAFEHLRANVELALREYGIRFPVGQDNDYRTWRAWSNRAWPSFYILDREARIVMLREGEGHAMEMERTIRGLLGLSPDVARRNPPDDMDLSRVASPEMYFGAIHPTPQEAAQSPRRGVATYAFIPGGPRLNRYELDGSWARDGEPLVLRSDQGRLRLHYSAAKVHFVAGAPDGATVRVRSGTEEWRTIRIGWPALYTVVDGTRYGELVMELEATSPGLSLYSATFG